MEVGSSPRGKLWAMWWDDFLASGSAVLCSWCLGPAPPGRCAYPAGHSGPQNKKPEPERCFNPPCSKQTQLLPSLRHVPHRRFELSWVPPACASTCTGHLVALCIQRGAVTPLLEASGFLKKMQKLLPSLLGGKKSQTKATQSLSSGHLHSAWGVLRAGFA